MKVLASQPFSFPKYSHFKFHKNWRLVAPPRRQLLKSTTHTSLGSRMRSIQDMIKIFFASYKASSRVYTTRKVCHANSYWRLYEFLCQFSMTKFKRVVMSSPARKIIQKTKEDGLANICTNPLGKF